MLLYGYSEQDRESESVVPSKLAEVTLCASQWELRSIAQFLEHCASEMDRMGAVYDHIHLSDRMKQFQSSPHFVVAKTEGNEG
jgi:hypothetical protein